MERMLLQWKGMGIVKYVPFFVCYLLVPVTIYVLTLYNDANPYKAEIAWTQIMLFYPIISAWWITLVMEISTNEDGEVFYLYEKNQWADALICYAAFLVSILPVCLCLLNKWPDDIYPSDFAALFSQCFLSVGIVYLISCCLKSITVSFTVMMVFNMFIHGRISEIVDSLSDNYIAQHIFTAIPFLVLGIICLLLGKTAQEWKH